MHIHFIAIGGAVMHNLAIALKKKGHNITGSDDEIFDPSRSKLLQYNLLPPQPGWHPNKLSTKTDAVILGMHAKKNNPELKKAEKLKLKIYSFPEFLYEQSKNKKRIVIAGSHGKTTITSMVMHVLKENNIAFDYMVGSQLPNFETMVGFSDDAEIAVFEGDEYLSSPLDPSPKFIHYKPYLTLISGISWDHLNVFPDYNNYRDQFVKLCDLTDHRGKIFFYQHDIELLEVIKKSADGPLKIPYHALPYNISENGNFVSYKNREYKTNLLGRYNMDNLAGAMHVCGELGISPETFLSTITSFPGAARRQEMIFKNENITVFQDFAHSPSKAEATVKGFRESFPGKKLVAILELHTFSSLNRDFIPHYRNSMNPADEAIVFFNPEVVRQKNLPEIDPDFVSESFGRNDLVVITQIPELESRINNIIRKKDVVLLLMSSGNLGGIDVKGLLNKR